MKSKKAWLFVFAPIFLVGFVLLAGWVVMSLWNATLVPLLQVGIISFWQAVGLLVLSRILFGGFRLGPGGRYGGWRKDGWRNLSNDERLQMKVAWKERCRQRWENAPAQQGGAAQDTESSLSNS